jgi:hypothetical protein
MSGFIAAYVKPDYLLILDRKCMALEDSIEWLTAIFVLEVSSLVESALKTFAHTVFNVAS